MIGWRLLADLVLLVHAAYIAFVILGFVAIVIGAAAGSGWVRTFYFRAAHLVAILYPLVETLAGAICPLTALEDVLRVRAGEPGYPAAFVAYWLHRIIFHAWPPWVFATLYGGFAIAIAATFYFAPPDYPWRRPRVAGLPG